jgi:hypothetical protein
MRTQVLEPLLANKTAFWHPLDFQPGISCVGWKKETLVHTGRVMNQGILR